MSEYIIPVYGIIGSPESKDDKRTYFTYSIFLSHLEKSKEYDEISLDIASLGGYTTTTDLIIKDLENTKKIISTFNSGDVQSCASKLFMLGADGQRVFYPTKGKFLIHNPWETISGDAEAHLELAIALKQAEDEFVNWYSTKTGQPEEVIKELMTENIALTNEQIEELNFATVVKETVKGFVRTININENNINLNKMDEKQKANALESLLKGFMDKIKGYVQDDSSYNTLTIDADKLIGTNILVNNASDFNGFIKIADGQEYEVVGGKITKKVDAIVPASTETGQENTIKALAVNDANGNELEFPDITDLSELVVGTKATLKGANAEGEFVMVDGSTVVIVAGVVTEIKPKVEEETEEMKALKVKNEELENTIKALNEEKENVGKEIKALTQEVTRIKALASNETIGGNEPTTIETVEKPKFSYKRK